MIALEVPKTADLCDVHIDRLQVAAPVFKMYGAKTSFYGPISTVKVFEDNTLVRAMLTTAGQGRVLVIDGGGSLNCALVGDQLAQLAVDNNWAGLIVNGCIRDAAEISRIAIGIKALNTMPRKSIKRGAGEIEVEVHFADVTFATQAFVYSDDDGIVIANEPLSNEYNILK